MNEATNTLEAGAVVGHFEVVRLLGSGGMGQVFLARDLHLGRRVALKVLHAARLGDERSREGFMREARLTATLSHPHIVTVFEVGEHDLGPFLALEYLEGESLQQRLARERPGRKQALRMGLAIAEALEEAHAQGVFHRDLKPGNVVIPRDGRLRVVDFGLARRAEAPLGRSPPTQATGARILDVERGEAQTMGLSTADSSFAGTPRYMAPEQWEGGQLTPATDIWALGLILVQMIWHRLPFAEMEVLEIGAAVLADEPMPIPFGELGLPASLSELLARMVQKDASLRPSATDVCAVLGPLVHGSTRREGGDVSPFRGLAAFAEEQGEFFFGRDTEIEVFVERWRERAILPIIGPSGTGKSSFFQAGVLPRLREQGPLTVISLRPGMRPLRTLAARLAGSVLDQTKDASNSAVIATEAAASGPEPGESAVVEFEAKLRAAPDVLGLTLDHLARETQTTVLLFVDQLEEVYTLEEDEAARRAFVQALCSAAADPRDPVRVAFTLRDDFLGRVAQGVDSRGAFDEVTLLQRPGAEALREILTAPLAAVGYQYEDAGVVGDMIAAVGAESASLPLLQFAARLLWDKRDEANRRITREAYRAIGGVEGALATHADAVLGGLSDASLEVVRELLLRLITPQGTRRAVPRARLLEGLTAEASAVLDRLLAARLLNLRRRPADAVGGGDFELAHESLIRSWPQLSRWFDSTREELVALAEVEQAAELWRRRGALLAEVWIGAPLRDAERRLSHLAAKLPASVVEFLDAGRRRDHALTVRRRVAIGGGIATLAAIAVVSMVVALAFGEKKRQADAQRQQAELRSSEALREGAQAAFLGGDTRVARARLRASLEGADSPMARALWQRLESEPLLWSRAASDQIRVVAVSPDGRWVAGAGLEKGVHVVEAVSGTGRFLRGQETASSAVSFSRDSKMLAVVCRDGSLWIWDLATFSGGRVLGAGSVATQNIARRPPWAADGRIVYLAQDGSVIAFDPRSGASEPVPFTGQVTTLIMDDAGEWIATWKKSGEVIAWGAGQAAPAVSWKPAGLGKSGVGKNGLLAMRPAARQMAALAEDGTLSLWLRPQGGPGVVGEGGAAPLAPSVVAKTSPGGFDMGFIDDEVLWVAGSDAALTLRDAGTGAPRETPAFEGSAIGARKGTLVVARSIGDSSLLIADARTGRPKGRLIGHTLNVSQLAVPAAGDALASAGWDQTLRYWDLSLAIAGRRIDAHESGMHGLALAPASGALVTASFDRRIVLWSDRDGTPVKEIALGETPAQDVAVSPDGRWMSVSGQGFADIRGVSGVEVTPPRARRGLTGNVITTEFDPTGRYVATGSWSGSVQLWAVGSGKLLHEWQNIDGVNAVAFTPTGEHVIASVDDGSLHMWRCDNGAAVAPLNPRVGGGALVALAATKDGERVLAASTAGVVREWTWRRNTTRELELPGKAPAFAIALNPDETVVAVGHYDGRIALLGRDGAQRRVTRAHRGIVFELRYSSDGRTLYSASGDGALRAWSADDLAPVWFARPGARGELYTHRGWFDARGEVLDTKAAPAGAEGRAALAGPDVVASDGAEAGLCVLRPDGDVELWDDGGRHAAHVDGATAVRGWRRTCLVATPTATYRWDGRAAPVALEGRLLGADGDAFYLAEGERLSIVRQDGSATQALPTGATAVTRDGAGLLVGFTDGAIEHHGPQERVAYEQPMGKEITRLLGSDGAFVAAGDANGGVALWDRVSGKRLEYARVNGAVIHLALTADRLVAASENGHMVTIDLSMLTRPYCEVLRGVWERSPVTWTSAGVSVSPPPAAHPCARAP